MAGQAALAAGARQVVAVDLSEGMLRRGGAGGRPVAADAVALPFRDGSFDLVLAAFCLNHLDSLAAGLTEARRVGAAIAASMFAPGWTHPAKDAVDEAVRSFGYQPPAWHTALAPGSRVGDPKVLARYAAAAGFTHVRGTHHDRPDRARDPRRAGVVAAGHGPCRSVHALAGRAEPGRGCGAPPNRP